MVNIATSGYIKSAAKGDTVKVLNILFIYLHILSDHMGSEDLHLKNLMHPSVPFCKGHTGDPFSMALILLLSK